MLSLFVYVEEKNKRDNTKTKIHLTRLFVEQRCRSPYSIHFVVISHPMAFLISGTLLSAAASPSALFTFGGQIARELAAHNYKL